MAFHAGALWALHHDLGWDPRRADVIVGTSAGSIVGSLLRAGVAPEDLAAWASDASSTPHGRKFRALMRYADQLVPTASIPSPTAPGWNALGVLRHPTRIPAALLSLLPHGVIDHAPRLAMVDRVLDRWPTDPLLISAVRVGDGRLTWFGDAGRAGWQSVRPVDAVTASCAIPLIARPVKIAGHRYVDGGLHSPTNADVLAAHDLDLVIVSSPMGSEWNGSTASPARRLAQRRLRNEVRTLEANGSRVQVIGPDATAIASMGFNLLDRTRAAAVMRAAFVGTSLQLSPTVTAALRNTSPQRAV